jgi:glutathione S-transferase
LTRASRRHYSIGMLTLYHAHLSRSVRPRAMLEEIGVPYELRRVDLAAGEQLRPEFLALNPNGAVPVLVDGDLALWESAAICQYLADRFPEKHLAPPVGTPERARYYQWIHFAMCTLEPPAVAVFLNTIQRPEAERIPRVAEEGKHQLVSVVRVVDQALEGRSWIVGERLSTADVVLGTTLAWAQMMGLVGAEAPHALAYLARLLARPAFQRALAD